MAAYLIRRLDRAGWALTRRDDVHHIITVEAGHGWTIQHPVGCRESGLYTCPVYFAAGETTRWPEPGRYYAYRDVAGVLNFGDRIPDDD